MGGGGGQSKSFSPCVKHLEVFCIAALNIFKGTDVSMQIQIFILGCTCCFLPLLLFFFFFSLQLSKITGQRR